MMARAFPPLYSHKLHQKKFLTGTAGGGGPFVPPLNPPLSFTLSKFPTYFMNVEISTVLGACDLHRFNTGHQAVIRHQQLSDTVGLYGVFLHTRKSRQFRRGRGIVVNRKIRRNKLADDKNLTSLPKAKAVVFGYRSFKPSNAILLTLKPCCPIIAVPLPENCVIFSMFSGGYYFDFSFTFHEFF